MPSLIYLTNIWRIALPRMIQLLESIWRRWKIALYYSTDSNVSNCGIWFIIGGKVLGVKIFFTLLVVLELLAQWQQKGKSQFWKHWYKRHILQHLLQLWQWYNPNFIHKLHIFLFSIIEPTEMQKITAKAKLQWQQQWHCRGKYDNNDTYREDTNSGTDDIYGIDVTDGTDRTFRTGCTI